MPNCEVVRENFFSNLPAIKKAIDKAAFISKLVTVIAISNRVIACCYICTFSYSIVSQQVLSWKVVHFLEHSYHKSMFYTI